MLSFPVICNNDNPKTSGISSIADYLGLPTDVLIKDDVSALPFAAYQKVWFDYYRDQNLQDMPAENVYELVDGINPNYLTFQRVYVVLSMSAFLQNYFLYLSPK